MKIGDDSTDVDQCNVKYQDIDGFVTTMNGSISISSLEVTKAKQSFNNDISSTVEFKANQSNDPKVVFSGSLTAKKSDLTLTNAVMTLATDNRGEPTSDYYTFTVYVNGSSIATLDFDKNTQTNSDGILEENESLDDGITIKQGSTATVRVEANANAAATTADLIFALGFEALDGNDNDADVSPENTTKIRVVASQGVTVTSNAAVKANTLVLSETDQALAHFIVKPANKATSAEIDTIAFNVDVDVTGITPQNVDSFFKIIIGKGNSATTVDNLKFDGTTLSAEDISETINGETEVTLVYKKDLEAGEYVTTLTNMNGAVSKTFNTQAVDALVRIVAQSNENAATTYTFEVENADGENYTITDFTIYGVGIDDTGSHNFGEINDGDKKSVVNTKDQAAEIIRITYSIDDGNETTSPTPVAINKKGTPSYEDFFKVNGNMLVVYKA